jgi:cytochrome c biogenesis protein
MPGGGLGRPPDSQPKRETAVPDSPLPAKPVPARPSLLAGATDFFSAVPLALFLLIALAATSIFGTVILQGGGQEQYVGEYGEGMTSFIRLLALDDMYHSWWFLSLLGLLLLNIVLCSARRFPRAWRLMTGRPEPLGDDLFRRLKYRASLRHGGDPVAALASAEAMLASRIGKPARIEDAASVTLTSDRGWYGRLGVYVTHLSILILALGVLYGGMTGYRGDVELREGQSVSRIPLRGRSSAVVLPFTVRCDKFTIEFYGNGQPKGYYSDLVIIDGGREAARKKIRVNDPLRYQGWSFFQSSYGTDPSSTVTLEVLDPGGRIVAPDITVRQGDKFTVPNDSSEYVVGALTASAPGIGGAMVEFHLYRGSEHSDFAVIEKNPRYDAARRGPVYFRIKSAADVRPYTGLEVAKDPGVPVIWLACVIMMAGLYITFFVAHQRVWVRVEKDPATTTVLAAGTTSRNPVVFEREFEEMVAEMKKSLKER